MQGRRPETMAIAAHLRPCRLYCLLQPHDGDASHPEPHDVPTPDLPPIDADLRRRLTDDILKRGVLVPILQAEDGEVLDGRLRLEIAEEHGVFCPRILVGKLTPTERADLRVAVNLYRRHLSREQVRHLVEWALRQEPEASDRRIAGKCGVSPTTVATARGIVQSGQCQPDYRVTSDGRRYPSARKPVVITSSDSQAREAARLLGELGDDAPDRPLNVRDLRTLRYEQARNEALSRAARNVKLGDDFASTPATSASWATGSRPGSVSA